MMSGDLGDKKPFNRAMTTISGTMPDHMSKSVSSIPSPLKIFGNAKKRIRDIFVDVGTYIEETKQFVQDVTDEEIISSPQRVYIGEYTDKVNGIREVLRRDHMKVVFFGRTSNGKSTTINSMLRSKILPSGIGHTTNCFVQVEGTDTQEGYLLLEGSDEKKCVSSLKDLANALSSMKLEENSLIRICWPKNKCSLLKDDVVLVDSPGIDVSPDLDSWIDKHCMDADVFVLVANAESTLMQTEKNFFLKVSDKLSKPTVFILNNRWDASASEPEMMEMVRSQHMERSMQFLSQELKVVGAKEAEDRIFFVSAKECLHQRLTESGASTTPLGSVLEGYQSRLFEFANFERKFEECLSRSAVKTKFAQHARKGKQMSCELRDIMDTVMDKCQTLRDDLTKQRTYSSTRLDQLEKRLTEISGDVDSSITIITDDVQLKVSRALSEEIRRLYDLVDDFDRPFHSDPMFMDIYKKELHSHVENGLDRKIQARCSSALNELVHVTEAKMTERLLNLLPEEKLESARGHFTGRPQFSVEFHLDARNLCADFREDIEFRFSFSPSALLSRYMGRDLSITALWGQQNPQNVRVNVTGRPQPTAGPDIRPAAPAPAAGGTDLAVQVMRLAPYLSSGTTLSCVFAAGAIGKFVGWKVFAVVGGVYCVLYTYERLMWSNSAKERAFKSQYVSYAGSKLQQIVDMTSANTSHQVQQELSGTFSRLKHQVQLSKAELNTNIQAMDREIASLDSTANKAKILRNKAGWLNNELNDFITRFIEYS